MIGKSTDDYDYYVRGATNGVTLKAYVHSTLS